jgi:ERCC4-related helicase
MGIIVFMAPTRPLVTQQMKACHSVVGIPEYDCAHLEGSVTAKVREQAWKEKRVVYCTPQTLMNDLTSGRVDAKKIVCVVVDEAHRATRNYAYTTVVEEISKHSSRFRILALSATPGSDKRQIQEVIEFIWCGGNVYV